MSNIQSFFSENGYYLAKGVYDSSQLPGMQDDFDRIVRQLLASKENINARWGSQLTRELEDADSVVYHTHNVQCYSAIWLQALLNPDFWMLQKKSWDPTLFCTILNSSKNRPIKVRHFLYIRIGSIFPHFKIR